MALPEADASASRPIPSAAASAGVPGLPDRMEPPRRDGCGRGASLGCLVLVVVLLVLLLGSFLQLDRGVHWVTDRALERLRRELPGELPLHERERFLTVLDRVEDMLESPAARDRVLGPFLRDAGAVLEDDSITVDEVAALERRLNVLLEDAPAAEG